MNTLHVVKYSGHFGFIKPFTAVRDELTFSQQFLTPSMIEGIKRHLEVSSIERHKISCEGMTIQQETIQAIGVDEKTKIRKTGIIKLGLLINPWLHLAFENESDANLAYQKHVCLTRNEYILHPEIIFKCSSDEFDSIVGIELVFNKKLKNSILVGYNRFDSAKPMYGQIKIQEGFIR